jgi:hypothetical protein
VEQDVRVAVYFQVLAQLFCVQLTTDK